MLRYETNGEQYDFPPYDGRPRTRYLIASTPRSGSNMLTRALWQTGKAGFPEEYFTDVYVGDFALRWKIESLTAPPSLDLRRYVEQLWRFRTSENGVFGAKAHPSHLRSKALAGRDVDDVMDHPLYIWIQRADVVRQAISYAIAEQTGVWIVDGTHLPLTEPSGNPRYDDAAIVKYLRLIEADITFWDRYFESRKIFPHVVQYEKLVSDYPSTMTECLRFLGIDDVDEIPSPGISQQANSTSDEWYERFRSERAS